MRTHVAFVCVALAAVGCKKTGGGTGGGGGWLVGSSGLMVNVNPQGQLGAYDLGASTRLDAIACRYQGEAWVTGATGTLLYTSDGGATWTAQAVPATGELRAVATQDAGPVFVAGDGAFLVTADSGAIWTNLGDAQFRAVAAAQLGDTVLALSEDGGVWSYSKGALIRRGACYQVEILFVVGRHPVGSLPVSPRGLGGRYLRRQQFQRQNPGRRFACAIATTSTRLSTTR